MIAPGIPQPGVSWLLLVGEVATAAACGRHERSGKLSMRCIITQTLAIVLDE
jgi:hypothetical protein